MSVVVDGGPAGIHADFVVAKRAKLFDLRRHCVVEAKGHDFGPLDEPMILGVRGKRVKSLTMQDYAEAGHVYARGGAVAPG